MFNKIWNGLHQGSLPRQFLFYSLRVASVVVGLLGVFLLIGFAIQIGSGLNIGRLVAGLLILPIYLLGLAFLVSNLWKRAGELRSISPGEHPATDIGVVMLRLGGETLATVQAVTGLAGAILIWFTGRLAFELFPFLGLPFFRPILYGEPVRILLAGLFTLGLWLGLAAICLLGHYMLAELVIIFKGIFKNTQKLPAES